MIANSTKRAILRWTHLMLAIPVLGYIYGDASQVQQYAPAVRSIFVPVMILSGYWMYAGAWFSAASVGLWLVMCHFFGYGAAVLGQVVLLVARKVWLSVRAGRTAARNLGPAGQ